jgi:hypothetical protein
MDYSLIPGRDGDEMNRMLTGKMPMHPDDSAALLAWITAKRFHEIGCEKSLTEYH